MPRPIPIHSEVRALLTKLFRPKYANVLDGELVSLLADGIAHTLRAIEFLLKAEANKHDDPHDGSVIDHMENEKKLELLKGLQIDVLRELAWSFRVTPRRTTLTKMRSKIAISELFDEVSLDAILNSKKTELLKGLQIGVLRGLASTFEVASEKKLANMRSKIAIAELFDEVTLRDILVHLQNGDLLPKSDQWLTLCRLLKR